MESKIPTGDPCFISKLIYKLMIVGGEDGSTLDLVDQIVKDRMGY